MPSDRLAKVLKLAEELPEEERVDFTRELLRGVPRRRPRTRGTYGLKVRRQMRSNALKMALPTRRQTTVYQY
jgi:hypothetical protein